MWLAPVQVKVLPISERHYDKAREVAGALRERGVRAECDDRNEKIGYRIREAQLEKVPYMLVIGDKECEEGTVSVRVRGQGDVGSLPLEQFTAQALEEIATRKR